MKPITFCLMALSLTALLSGCAKAPTMPQTSWSTITVNDSAYILPANFSAKIQGKEDAKIYPQVSGTLFKRYISEGDFVKEGQALFLIDPKPFELSVQAAKADLATAKANLSTAKLNYESTQTLYDKAIVSHYVLETARNNYESAQAVQEVAEASLALAKNDLNHCTVVSAVSGIVGQLPYSVGDLVGPNISTPLTTVSDNHIIAAYFSLNENQYTQLLAYRAELFQGDKMEALEQSADVELRLKSGQMYSEKGRIVSLSGVVDAMTGAVVCKAEFPNPNGELASGISGTVVYPVEYQNVKIIPNTAVTRLQDKMLVYVVQPDSTVKSTLIEVESIDDGKQLIVKEGLANGDVIVASGVNKLADGMKVLF